MVKEAPPPPAKQGPTPHDNDLSDLMKQVNVEFQMYVEMPAADNEASENIQKFLSALPPASHSQFLAAISSDEFLKNFPFSSFNAVDDIQVKFEHNNSTTKLRSDTNGNEDKAYAAFATAQSNTSKVEYECYKRQYRPVCCHELLRHCQDSFPDLCIWLPSYLSASFG
jgi:hypothetical protein